MTTILFFAAGLVLLVAGAELLVRGASKMAALAGISPLVIGLTVVAYGTSSPEFAVSISSALNNQPDLVIGNVVGSNIFNILFILGLTAIISPVVVAQKLVKIELPLLIAISLALIVFAADSLIGRIDALLLTAGMILYTFFVIRESRRETKLIRAEYSKEFSAPQKKTSVWILNGIYILAGLALLVFGSDMMVKNAITIARYFGLSELIIGLTIVAAGTSMPEVATSVLAAIKGENDIAAGNIIGSNIFNILAVLGIPAFITPITVSDAAIRFDIPVMIAAAAAALPVLFSGFKISRWEGVLFLFYYAAYTVYLLLESTQHDALGPFSSIMITFVVPLTVITLLIIFYRSYKTAGSK